MADLIKRAIYKLHTSDIDIGVHTGNPNEFIGMIVSPVENTLHYVHYEGQVEYLGLVEDKRIQLRKHYAGYHCYYCGAACTLSSIGEWFHNEAQLDGCVGQPHALANGPYLPLIDYLNRFIFVNNLGKKF